MAQRGISPPTFIDDVIQFHPPGPRRKVSVTSCFNFPFLPPSFSFFFFFLLFFSFFLFLAFSASVCQGARREGMPRITSTGEIVQESAGGFSPKSIVNTFWSIVNFFVSLSVSLSLSLLWNLFLFGTFPFFGIFPFLEYFLFWSISFSGVFPWKFMAFIHLILSSSSSSSACRPLFFSWNPPPAPPATSAWQLPDIGFGIVPPFFPFPFLLLQI